MNLSGKCAYTRLLVFQGINLNYLWAISSPFGQSPISFAYVMDVV